MTDFCTLSGDASLSLVSGTISVNQLRDGTQILSEVASKAARSFWAEGSAPVTTSTKALYGISTSEFQLRG